jgi:hypothetical protein
LNGAVFFIRSQSLRVLQGENQPRALSV